MIVDRFDRRYFSSTRDFIRLYYDFCDSKSSPESFSFFISILFLKYYSEHSGKNTPIKIPKYFTFSQFRSVNDEEDNFINICKTLSEFFSINFPEDEKYTSIINFDKSVIDIEDLAKKTNILIMQLEQNKYNLKNIHENFFFHLFKSFQQENIFIERSSRTIDNTFKVMFSLIEKKGYEHVLFSGIDNGVFFDFKLAENYRFKNKIIIKTNSVYFWLIQKLLFLCGNIQNISVLGPLDPQQNILNPTMIHFPKSFRTFRNQQWFNIRKKSAFIRPDFSDRERIPFDELYAEYLVNDCLSVIDSGYDIFLFVDAKTLSDEIIKDRFFVLFNERSIDTVIRLPNRFFSGNYMQSFVFVIKEKNTENTILFIDASCLTESRTRNDITQDLMNEITDIYLNRKEYGVVSKIYADTEDLKSNIFTPIISEVDDLNKKDRIRKLRKEIKAIENEIEELEDEIEINLNENLLNPAKHQSG